MGRVIHLTTPISEEQIRDLQLDDEVYLTGEAYGMLYADHYTILLEKLRNGEPLPEGMRLDGGVLWNTGAIWRHVDGERKLFATCATTSNKYDPYTPEMIKRAGIRAIIGKGGHDEACLEAMKEYGCVYLAISGGCCAVYTPNCRIADEYEPKSPPTDNQRLKYELHEFGPLFVSMDAHGNSLFRERAEYARSRKPAIYEKLNIRS